MSVKNPKLCVCGHGRSSHRLSVAKCKAHWPGGVPCPCPYFGAVPVRVEYSQEDLVYMVSDAAIKHAKRGYFTGKQSHKTPKGTPPGVKMKAKAKAEAEAAAKKVALDTSGKGS